VLGEVCHAGTTFGLQDFLRQVKEGETRIVGQNLGVIVRRRRTKLRVCGSCAWQILSNEQGLLLCWYFIMSSPEPLLIEKLKLKLTTKSQIEFRRLELLLIANKKMRIYSSASIAANPMLPAALHLCR